MPSAWFSNEAPGSPLPVMALVAIRTRSRLSGVALSTWMPYFALPVIVLRRTSATSAFVGPLPLPDPTLADRLRPLLQFRKTESRRTNVVLSAAPSLPATMQSPMLNGTGFVPPSLDVGGLPPRSLVPSTTTLRATKRIVEPDPRLPSSNMSPTLSRKLLFRSLATIFPSPVETIVSKPLHDVPPIPWAKVLWFTVS